MYWVLWFLVCCIVVGVILYWIMICWSVYCGVGYLYCIVWLFVCGIELGLSLFGCVIFGVRFWDMGLFIGLFGCCCVVLCWVSSLFCCVDVGVWYCNDGFLYWVVRLLVCSIELGVICIVLCGCWCVVLCGVLFELGSVVVGVWYFGGGFLYCFVWLLVRGNVLGSSDILSVFVGVWY